MKFNIRFIAALALAAAPVAAFTAKAEASSPNEERKVWVCHATAGQASLGNGYNLLNVDENSTKLKGHQQHSEDGKFNSFRNEVIYDLIDVGPNSDCGGPFTPPPPTTEPPCEGICGPAAGPTTPPAPDSCFVTASRVSLVEGEYEVPGDSTGSTSKAMMPCGPAEPPTPAPTPAPATPVAGPALPATGGSLTWILAAIGAALVAAGAGLRKLVRS